MSSDRSSFGRGEVRRPTLCCPRHTLAKKPPSRRTDGRRRRRRSCDKNDSNIIGAKVAPPSSEGAKKGTEHTAPGALLLLHPSAEEGHGETTVTNTAKLHLCARNLCATFNIDCATFNIDFATLLRNIPSEAKKTTRRVENNLISPKFSPPPAPGIRRSTKITASPRKFHTYGHFRPEISGGLQLKAFPLPFFASQPFRKCITSSSRNNPHLNNDCCTGPLHRAAKHRA